MVLKKSFGVGLCWYLDPRDNGCARIKVLFVMINEFHLCFFFLFFRIIKVSWIGLESF
jgi:hypothetical protein